MVRVLWFRGTRHITVSRIYWRLTHICTSFTMYTIIMLSHMLNHLYMLPSFMVRMEERVNLSLVPQVTQRGCVER